jgi:hypothetical protein
VPGPGPPPAAIPSGYIWALCPLLTLGAGTPFSFLYAALRFKSWQLGATAVGYGAAWGAVVASGFLIHPVISVLAWVLLWIGGSVHAFAIREDIYPRTTDRLREQVNERALAAAKSRQELRRRAREIATREPAVAHELRIGRPDLARTFDDGGLIDVNHAPPPTLALLPGLTGEVLERVVEVRAKKQGGFVSAEELGVDADLSPDLVPKIAEYAIFLP